jgi:hypothetical protein
MSRSAQVAGEDAWQAYCRRRAMERRFDGPLPRHDDQSSRQPEAFLRRRMASRKHALAALLKGAPRKISMPDKPPSEQSRLLLKLGNRKTLPNPS